METKILNYTFVGMWSKLLTAFPAFSDEFARSLFKDSISTNLSMTPQGVVITNSVNQNMTESVLIDPLRLQISSTELNNVPSITQKIINKLVEAYPVVGYPFTFSTIGLTEDFETDNIGEAASNWLGNNFLKNNLLLENEFENAKINIADLTFQVETTSKQKYLIQVQPRQTNETSLFFRITTTTFGTYDCKTIGNSLQQMFDDSTRQVEENIFKIFKL